LRPIAEIQYLDYLLYGLQPLSDDVSTTHFRTAGQQSVPLIVRTRGHRLEGIWHSGSPMGMMVHALRGMYICVPRNMTQAVGMYNTLLRGNDPGIIVECLNGYRLKEKLPENILEYTIPLGVPEIVKEGDDITLVSYGSTLRIVQEAAERLENQGVSCEVVDVQTLLPFDIHHIILSSLRKTNRILFIDEDVPGGATAYMYNKVIEEQKEKSSAMLASPSAIIKTCFVEFARKDLKIKDVWQMENTMDIMGQSVTTNTEYTLDSETETTYTIKANATNEIIEEPVVTTYIIDKKTGLIQSCNSTSEMKMLGSIKTNIDYNAKW
jgi:pyruvate/2-oxoglutarate/acetoin dehydrogenase E1 component